MKIFYEPKKKHCLKNPKSFWIFNWFGKHELKVEISKSKYFPNKFRLELTCINCKLKTYRDDLNLETVDKLSVPSKLKHFEFSRID